MSAVPWDATHYDLSISILLRTSFLTSTTVTGLLMTCPTMTQCLKELPNGFQDFSDGHWFYLNTV